MIAYGIGFLPLIRELQEATPQVTHPWYENNAGAGGTFHHTLVQLWYMQARGLPRGYFPEPTNSTLVVAPRNVARVEEFFLGMGLHIVTGSWYLGCFIVNEAAEKIWLAVKVEGLADSVGNLAGVSRKHPQYAYAGLQKSLQHEWAFVQRVTPGIGDAFGPVDRSLRKTFLLSLCQGFG